MIDRRKLLTDREKLQIFLDTIYDEMIFLLKNRVSKIYLVRDPNDADPPGKMSCGFLDDDDEDELRILINSRQDRDERVRTLIHELLHFIMKSAKEPRVRLELESIMWEGLSDRQKNLLASYLPKKITHRRFKDLL